jgi:V/A-type H+-transporting ATPase subunit I
MMRLSVVVLERAVRAALRELGRLGAVQLTRTPAGGKTAPLPPPDHTEEIARCDRIQSRVAELRRTLQAGKVHAGSQEEMTFETAQSNLAGFESKAQALVSRREIAMRRLAELDNAAPQVEGLCGVNVPLDEIGRLEFLHFVTGSLPEGAMARIDVGDDVALFPRPVQGGREGILAVTPRARRVALEEALTKAGFQGDQIPAAVGVTADEFLAGAQRERARISSEIARRREELEALAADARGPLAELEAWAEVERRLLEAEQLTPRTEAAVLITGWIPEGAAPAVEQCLIEKTGGRCVVEIAPPGDVPEAEIPVLLQHSRWLRPFQMLVSAYGLPRYRELAPTLFVAMSYVLMFGMMFGDVGHGGLLALGGLIVMGVSCSPKIRDLGVLFLFNGLSSAAFGAVYGSWFGIPRLKEYALWHDPLEADPMMLMQAAMGVGVVLMSIGLVLNIVNRCRHRQWVEALLGKFGVMGVVFYWGALALFAKAAAIRAQGWWSLALILFLGLPILCWALKEPVEQLHLRRAGQATGSDGMVAAITESLVGAFEGILLYLANTVSFVRLAAYAMSHAALLMATFTLADEVGRISVGGPLFSLAVVIVGNLVAMVLEGIVASVQALRLEYYEFFGKFFSGEGRPFTPFSLQIEEPDGTHPTSGRLGAAKP